ncbi:MAG TPA: hypothetical protein PLW65_23790 [Pseudomonadota bacterium]|nr:hypothetical protein [Pseudomonadota bacterium]
MAYDGLRGSVGMWLKTQYDGLLLAALLLGPALLAASRDLDWFDGPELALAAVIGGVAHPPGEPLHTLLAGLLARLMPAYLGVALASVLPLCLLAVPMIRLVDHLSPPASGRDRLLRGAVVAATLLGPPSFQTGTRVEVYCLAALFSLLAVNAAVARRALVAGLGLGLTACANPAFAVFAGAAVFILSCRSLRALGRVFAGGLLGLLPYVYLPWAGSHPERFIFGAPTTLRGFLDILLLRAYQHNLGSSAAGVLASLVTLRWLVLPAALALLIGSMGLGRSRARGLALALLTLGGLHLASLLINKPLPHNPDLHGYLIPTLLVSGMGLAALLVQRAERGRAWLLPAALALPVLALVLDGPWLWARSRGGHAMRALASAYLSEAPPQAVLILVTDHLYFPMLYLQEAEHVRPDLVLVNLGLAGNEWFWTHQQALHPELLSLGAELPATQKLARLVAQRPVLAQSGVLLRGLGGSTCEGTWLTSPAPSGGRCAAAELAPRLAILERMAADVRGDWLGERLVATQAIMLALESRAHGDLRRSAATLAASSRELASFAPLAATQSGPSGPRVPLRRLPADALASPDWVLYLLGRTLVDLGDGRGEELLARARSRGVAEAAELPAAD